MLSMRPMGRNAIPRHVIESSGPGSKFGYLQSIVCALELRVLIARASSAIGFAVAVAVLTASISTSEAAASERGQVGGPPTIALGPPDEGKRTTPDLVIGRGDTPTGAVELVGYGWLAPRDSLPQGPREQLCIWVEHLPKEISPGMCGPLLDPEGGQKIAIDDRIGRLGKPAQRFIEIGGRLTPDVASVRISYRRNGRRASGMAVATQVAGELQDRLHQPTPFGFFDLRIRGQVRWRSIQVQAFDDAGAVLETAGPASSAHRAHGKPSTTRSSGVEVPQPQIKFSRMASNGYSMFFEANRGRASLRLQGDAGGVVYDGKSSLVGGRIRFGLGKLGRIDVRFEPDGSVDRLRPDKSCRGREQVIRRGTFVGSIRFRGENGYTQLRSHRVHGAMAEPRSWNCPNASDRRSENASGVSALVAHTPHNRVFFMAIGGPEEVPLRFFVAGTSERVGALRIGRSVLVQGMPASFEALGDLSSATIGPPKPFSGTASYVHNIDGSTEWSGTLSVALPGAESTALTGPEFEADLAKPRTAKEFSELLGLD
jgi:hypothetical protein